MNLKSLMNRKKNKMQNPVFRKDKDFSSEEIRERYQVPPYKSDNWMLSRKEISEITEKYIGEAGKNKQYIGPEPIRAETRLMTEDDVRYINENAGDIIYAEWASVGAMGYCGTERVFIFRDKKLIEYVTEKDEYYCEVYGIFSEKLIFSKFFTLGAGVGNYAWKNRKIRFMCSDKNGGFVFEHGENSYLVKCSVRGVYNNIAHLFSE